MKKIIVTIVITGLILFSAADVYGGWYQTWRSQKQQRQVAETSQPGVVGAPLDGGLLAILAAAGGAYFVARKRKKKAE